MLLSLALVLSYIERFFPLQMLIPLPGMKLGLANIVTLVTLCLLGGRSAMLVLVLRCCLGSLFSGSVSGLMFSLTGGVLAMLTMLLARRVPFLSVYGVSILGAAAHNFGQICMAMILMQSMYISAYLPYLLIVSLFTGFGTGVCSAGVLRMLEGERQKDVCKGALF